MTAPAINAILPAPGDLSLEEKLGQLIVVRLGSDMPPVRSADEDQQRVAALLGECPIGGLVLFNGRHDTTPAALAQLQAASKIPLLVGADLERGYGQQLRPFPLFPHAMAFDALAGDAAATVYEAGRLTALASRRAGVHVAFAPVADANTDPRNPIIDTRAFSTDPARAAELASALVEGLHDGGMLACGKHFPGHGDTRQDSHHELPTVALSVDELRERELVPFRATIAAGVRLLMTAHVSYPGLDPSGACATLSRPILTDLLRNELEFGGAAISDSLLMAGVRAQAADEGDLCVQAVAAGVDLLLDVGQPRRALNALLAAVETGRLPMARVDEAVDRVLQVKQLAFAGANQPIGADAPQTSEQLESATQAAATRVAAAAVQVERGADGLPLPPSGSVLVVLINPYRYHFDPTTPELFAAVAEKRPAATCVQLSGDEPSERWEELSHQAAAADHVLAAIVVKPAAWHQFGLPSPATQWLGALCQRRDVAVACLGAPAGLRPFAAARTALCSFSDVPASQRALVDCLFPSDGKERGL